MTSARGAKRSVRQATSQQTSCQVTFAVENGILYPLTLEMVAHLQLYLFTIVLLFNERFVQSWLPSCSFGCSRTKNKLRSINRKDFSTQNLSGVNVNDSFNSDGDNLEQKTESKIYFDISIDGEEIGRMVFNIASVQENILPLHTENLIKLCGEDLKSIDPKCSYLKCAFKHSPQFVETMPQYRWAHVLDGRGRNAVGRAVDRISDPDGIRSCTHSCYGGVYHGLNYDETMGQGGVVISVPLVGAYRGSTSFSIVRVGESPQEWREKLLLNSAVLGWLESGIEVLHTMARQTRAPPIVSGSGRL